MGEIRIEARLAKMKGTGLVARIGGLSRSVVGTRCASPPNGFQSRSAIRIRISLRSMSVFTASTYQQTLRLLWLIRQLSK